jgi:hypothetical protein
MDAKMSPKRAVRELALDLDAVAGVIAETQLASGEIPWSAGDKTDPWDHVEAAMGLTTAGYFNEARRAFDWLGQMQNPDGSWYSAYRNGRPSDRTRDANMAAYLAVGVFHYYLVTGDRRVLDNMWPVLEGGIEFAVRLQQPEGEIFWAISPEGRLDPMALLTGSSSIHMSLKCALAIGGLLGRRRVRWQQALLKLAEAIRTKPYLFNMTKARFSMDWFYPILSGALTGPQARLRIDRYWKKYVEEERGVRCVSDEPWITIAETCELAIALSAMGHAEQARIVFNWIEGRRFDDGTFWCGFTVPDLVVWPEEKMTWTNAVALMAADAIYALTPAARLFDHQFWQEASIPLRV